MAGAFTAYMALKGLKKIYKFSPNEVYIYTGLFMILAYFASRPFINKQVVKLQNKKEDSKDVYVYTLLLHIAL